MGLMYETTTGGLTPGTTDPAHNGTQTARTALGLTKYDDRGQV
jgi:hypothetical protein